MRRQFEADTLGELRELAAGEPLVSWVTRPGEAGSVELGGILGPVELSAGGRRITAKAVWGPAWTSLSSAAAQGKVVLAGASRYSGSWLLRFRVLAGDQRGVRELPLLGAGLRILPHSGGDGVRLPSISPLQPVLV